MDDIVIIGGPNGAGKTTAAQLLVPQGFGISEFVNADEIARGLSPFNAEHAALAAGRLMLERIRELIKNRRYWAGLANLQLLYLPLADVAVVYDNSDGHRTLIAERLKEGSLVVHDAHRWATIERARP